MPNERKRRKLFWQHIQKPGESHPCDLGLENEIIGEGWELEPVKEQQEPGQVFDEKTRNELSGLLRQFTERSNRGRGRQRKGLIKA